MYHIDLDLSPDQVKQLKRLAIDRDLSVKEMVTRMVKSAIELEISKPVPTISKKPSK